MEKLEYRGRTIQISQDMHPSNPIEGWDGNVGYALFHNNYSFQNGTDLNTKDYGSWDEFKEALVKKYKTLAILPIYLYDHSGITMSTEPFGCRWDSGQIGFAYVNKEILKAWGYKSRRGYEKVAKKTLEEDIISNVQLYDDYITGNVYGFLVFDDEGEVDDSCWGYYGDLGKEDAIAEAKNIIDYDCKAKLKNKLTKLKKLVQYSVPLNLRTNILQQIN